MKISVVIPCHNEEASIEKVIHAIPRDVHEIVIVDNNSTDRTREIAERAGARVVREERQGYGAAYKKGFSVATGDVIVTLDGDGQYPAESIMDAVAYRENNNLDFVSCSRFPLQKKEVMSFQRWFGNKLLTIITRCLFGIRVLDSQSGMWVFRKTILHLIRLDSDDMPFSEEIKIRVATHPKLRFGEFPIVYHPRGGVSKLAPWKHGPMNIFYLLKMRIQIAPRGWRRIVMQSVPFLLACGIYLSFALPHMNAPFISVTSDTNGDNGVAAMNWVEHSPLAMQFGNYPRLARSPDEAVGKLYTNHPSWYLAPTYVIYKVFGISEMTTRLAPLLFTLLSMAFLYAACIALWKNMLYPFLVILMYGMLPGLVYYGQTFELAVFSLPAMLVTLSLFILYVVHHKPVYKYAFYLSIIVGGVMGWFYYFILPVIWGLLFFIRDNDFARTRKEFLFVIPTLACMVFFAMLAHIYICWEEEGALRHSKTLSSTEQDDSRLRAGFHAFQCLRN